MLITSSTVTSVEESGVWLSGSGLETRSHTTCRQYEPSCKYRGSVIVMTFWVCFWNGLNFFELFKLLFSLGIDHDPHVLYVHMTSVYFFSSHVSFFTRSYGQEKSLSYYDLFRLWSIYYMDAPPPSFSSISSTTPPPLYSPSVSNNDGPTWRRIPPGREG